MTTKRTSSGDWTVNLDLQSQKGAPNENPSMLKLVIVLSRKEYYPSRLLGFLVMLNFGLYWFCTCLAVLVFCPPQY